MKWLFTSSSASWVTGSDTDSVASKARSELTSRPVFYSILNSLGLRSHTVHKLQTNKQTNSNLRYGEKIEKHLKNCKGKKILYGLMEILAP